MTITPQDAQDILSMLTGVIGLVTNDRATEVFDKLEKIANPPQTSERDEVKVWFERMPGRTVCTLFGNVHSLDEYDRKVAERQTD